MQPKLAVPAATAPVNAAHRKQTKSKPMMSEICVKTLLKLKWKKKKINPNVAEQGNPRRRKHRR